MLLPSRTASGISAMTATKATRIVAIEGLKGSSQAPLSSAPVALEPPFWELRRREDLLSVGHTPLAVPEDSPALREWRQFEVWMPREYEFDWLSAELFLKQLQSLLFRFSFELIGNGLSVHCYLGCPAGIEPLLMAAFYGVFPDWELVVCRNHPFDAFPAETWESAEFVDYGVPPPYSHLLTRPSELKLPPLSLLLNNLVRLEAGTVGVYQALVQPVSMAHNWHQNIQILQDVEYLAKLHSGGLPQQRMAQQAPSGQLNAMTQDTEAKASPDKPLFAAAVRVAVLNSGPPAHSSVLGGLSMFMNLFQHGGRPMEWLTQAGYLECLGIPAAQSLLNGRNVYRAGMLVNSFELSGLLHFPCLAGLESSGVECHLLDGPKPAPQEDSDGKLIGYCRHAEQLIPLYVSETQRRQIHLIGVSDQGKSMLQENLILLDIQSGEGVMAIDPHGDLVANLLHHGDESWADRLFYFDPGDKAAIPVWNVLQCIGNGVQADRITDDLVHALVEAIESGWGHRLFTFLRQGMFGLAHTPNGALGDLTALFSKDARLREKVRQRILSSNLGNELAVQFWKHEYPHYRDDEFGPVQHKLAQFLLNDTVGPMFSSVESRFNLREMMDAGGKIILVNLSTVGREIGSLLGRFLVSLCYLAAVSRSDLPPSQRKIFHLYVDEAHRFLTGAIGDMIAETKKFKCSLCIANQYMGQWEGREVDQALGAVGTTVSFRVTANDAPHISKYLGGNVPTEELLQLAPGHAICRIGSEVYRIETPFLKRPDCPAMVERLKAASRTRYCLSPEAIRLARQRILAGETERPSHAAVSWTNKRSGTVEVLEYDEFI